MRRIPDPWSRLARVVATIVLVGAITLTAVVPATTPVRAQSGDAAAADDPRCLPDGGRDLTIGGGNPHIDVTIHTSLFTDSPPSALGLAARGVAVDAEIVELRTGVLLENAPEGLSPNAVWDAFVILFDYRFSLPMFAGSIGESVYEPTNGPVSGVETREC